MSTEDAAALVERMLTDGKAALTRLVGVDASLRGEVREAAIARQEELSRELRSLNNRTLVAGRPGVKRGGSDDRRAELVRRIKALGDAVSVLE